MTPDIFKAIPKDPVKIKKCKQVLTLTQIFDMISIPWYRYHDIVVRTPVHSFMEDKCPRFTM